MKGSKQPGQSLLTEVSTIGFLTPLVASQQPPKDRHRGAAIRHKLVNAFGAAQSSSMVCRSDEANEGKGRWECTTWALVTAFVGVILIALDFHGASASIRISADNGGPMGRYMEMFLQIRDSGEHVIIDGNCMSACTLVLAVVPSDRICVTPNARLGFHATWSPDQKDPATNASITRALLELYPPTVRHWIRLHGGLTKNMIVLAGPELMKIYRRCS